MIILHITYKNKKNRLGCLYAHIMLRELNKDSMQDKSLYSQFKRIRLILMQNCESDWTTESICKLAHMEKSQFYNYYTSFFNTTPKADIIFARIEKAKNLLANQGLNVGQVVEMCGFKSFSHFTRAFKKQANCSPSKYAQYIRGTSAIHVLYDLQKELGELSLGVFGGSRHLASGGEYPPKLTVVEAGGTKTLLVSDRPAIDSGLVLQVPALAKLLPGDKIIITGRICGTAPKLDWAMVMRRYGKLYANLAQHYIPSTDELFCITYVFDPIDLETPVQIRSNHWGKDDTPMDFFVDSILITREQSNANIEMDSRRVVYSFADDVNVKELKPGDITPFIHASGAPMYTVKEKGGKKSIRVWRRLNNWDGIDIIIPNMNLKSGNLYTIRAKGRVESPVPPGATMMFQVLPGFIWRSAVPVEDNGVFTLSHTLSIMELQMAEGIRIASNPECAGMSFIISEIEVRTKQLHH